VNWYVCSADDELRHVVVLLELRLVIHLANVILGTSGRSDWRPDGGSTFAAQTQGLGKIVYGFRACPRQIA
jgi:hypothetical protein